MRLYLNHMKNPSKYRSKDVNEFFKSKGPITMEALNKLVRLPKEFYSRGALDVCPDLLGLLLVHKPRNQGSSNICKSINTYNGLLPGSEACNGFLPGSEARNGPLAGIITEVEAYAGPEDKACHAYNMRRTKRNEVMYGPPGIAYVYFTYGMHYCFNVVVSEEGNPHAVLIRSIEPVLGESIMLKRRKGRLPLASGPGRLCQAMGITKEQNGAGLITGNLYIAKPPDSHKATGELQIVRTPRIGINYAAEASGYLWRFMLHPKTLGNRQE